MKSSILRRIAAACLCLCMLPSLACAYNGDETPVTRSDFTAQLQVYADGFPNDGAAHYDQWQTFFDKLSLRGVMDTQHPWEWLNRVYFDGGLYLNDEKTIPFEYDSYISFRYVRSPALDGASVHFQMNNFFQFMMKAYYYMGLPTQYIALPLYPQAWTDLYDHYREPITRYLSGEGSRVIDYDTLYELCQELNLIIQEDLNDRAYYFITCLLIDLGLSDMLVDRLAYLEDWLDYLDPESEGLTISADGENETWVLGEYTLLEKTAEGFTFLIPDYEGFEYGFSLTKTDDHAELQALVLMEGEEYANVTITASGLPDEGDTSAEGRIDMNVSGSGFYYDVAPISLAFRYERTAEKLPYDMNLEVDYLHPETGLPAIGLRYQAACEEQPYTVLQERPYDNQDDFFNLNEGFLAEYKTRFLPTLALSAAPIALEVTPGMLSDIYTFLDYTGFLPFLGIE